MDAGITYTNATSHRPRSRARSAAVQSPPAQSGPPHPDRHSPPPPSEPGSERPQRLVAAVTAALRECGVPTLSSAQLDAVARRTVAILEAEERSPAARAALQQECEGRYRTLFEMSGDAVFLIDATGRIREANATAARLHGFSVAELTAMRITDLDTPESARESPARVREILAGRTLTFEVEHRRKDGSRFPLEVTASPVRLNGEVFVLAFDRDITARKEAEDTRARALAQIQATLESTTDGILTIDSAGRIQSYNRRFAEMWHLPEAVLATHDDDLALSHALPQLQDPEAFLAQVRELYARPLAESFDTLLLKDGRTFERFSRPQILNGAPAGRVWSFRDVTARVRAEEQRARLEASLRLAKRLESLGTLAGGVAHDFNNLLGGMCGYVEITKERLPEDHAVQPTLGLALELGQRARELMRKILTFSQQTESDFRTVDLAAVVAEGLSLSRFTLPAGAELHTHFASHCPRIAADATQLHQVVLNLCTNAAHALPDQGGRIDVTVATAPLPPSLAVAHPLLADGPVVRLAVTDNGCGMDAATLERIFEPFFTTKGPGKGTGLGLSVVHGIVSAHSGAIDVRSERGRGTTFELYFPALKVEMPTGSDAASADQARGFEETILWVDDNPATGQVIEHLLITSGFHVVYCNSSPDALARFQAAPDQFDLLLTDLSMPDLDGQGLAQAVLAIRPNLPVLVVTGMVDAEQVEALQAAGISAVIFKPVRREDLARSIAAHLPPRGARSSPS